MIDDGKNSGSEKINVIFHIIHRQLPQCKFKTYVQFIEYFWNNFFNLNFNQFCILAGISSAMGNLRPFNLFSVALLDPLKYAYFIEKSTKSVEKVSILAST
jgi:hypothetical protein